LDLSGTSIEVALVTPRGNTERSSLTDKAAPNVGAPSPVRLAQNLGLYAAVGPTQLDPLRQGPLQLVEAFAPSDARARSA